MKTLNDIDLHRILPHLDLSDDYLNVGYKGRYLLLTHMKRRADMMPVFDLDPSGNGGAFEQSLTHGPEFTLAAVDRVTGFAWAVRQLQPGGNFDMANFEKMTPVLIEDLLRRLTPEMICNSVKTDMLSRLLSDFVTSTSAIILQETAPPKDLREAASIVPLRLLEHYAQVLNLSPSFMMLDVEDQQLHRSQVKYTLTIDTDTP